VEYRWDGDQLAVQRHCLADGTAAREVQWVYEPGSYRPLAQVEAKGEATRLHYIVTDVAGTARELCSEEGEIHWRGEQGLWDGYREERIPLRLRRYLGDAANEEVYCELRYQGQIYDRETGLYYNRHRYYDGGEDGSQQYLSPDPSGFDGGIRPQGYVHNPLEWVDPLGLVGCPGSSHLDNPKKKVNSAEIGDTVRTPSSHPDDFTKMRGGNYKNNSTGEIWSKSDTIHSDKSGEWKVGIGKNEPTPRKKITIGMSDGKIIKLDNK
ncbi:RHS repeat-associated core domain-containing protein, partial [Brenneria alni]|uniref:RHS repeat-associated core domain-containing protein n=1 Tax=Brenneria alni TaxID=71656 RepID=UPI001F0C4A92